MPLKPIALCLCCFGLAATASLPAVDKNGVSPRAISLPSGPGSIQGLGESFQPQLNSGSGSTGVQLVLPRGPGGITPEVSLAYNSGGSNGILGLGWTLTGMLSVRRNTDDGVPLYVDGPNGVDDDLDDLVDNPEEIDNYTGLSGEELVPLADGSFRAENESAFLRYVRSGAGWEARSRDGRRYLFGINPAARVEDSGRIFEWCVERIIDPNGNTIDFEYATDPEAPAQKYLRRLRWGSSTAYLAAVLTYDEDRPDVFTSYRSCFEIRTRWRLRGLDVVSHGIPADPGALRGDLDGASEDPGTPEALIRKYRFEYQEGAHLSLLTRVTQVGLDGVTALPTLGYEYRLWTPPNNVGATVIRSKNAPTEGLDSPSVELIDMNADGLPDLLSTSSSQHRIFLNRGLDADGKINWGAGRPIPDAPTIDISSNRTHLADATADGLADLMVKASNTTFLCFDNSSEGSWIKAPFPLSNTDTWPIWPFDGASGALSRSFDSDYNRSNDVLHTSGTGMQLWMLRGGRYVKEVRLPALVCNGKTFRFDQLGATIADLNGDRLQDLAWIQPTRIDYFPSRGRGDFAPPITLDLGRTLTSDEIARTDFSDVDGDGLVDVTLVRPASLPNGVMYWLNRFERGLDGPRTLTGLPSQGSGDALRWADLNGNGTTDIVISQTQSAPGEKILVVDFVPEGKPYLLRRADNGLGRVISMEYEPSTAQMVRAEAEGRPWSTRMPIAVTVVRRIVEEDGLSPPTEQVLSYRDPFYDAAKQEFRGFRGAENQETGDASAATRIGRFLFDTGRTNPCLKGKQVSEEILGDDGKVYQRTATEWQTRVLAGGLDGRQVCYATAEAVDQLVLEGEASGLHLRTENEHDDFGNTILQRKLGIVDIPGDEVITEREYDLRPQVWRLDLLAREVVRNGQGQLVADRRQFHDVRGNLEREERWLESENRFIQALRQTFDGFGNVVGSVDARGNRRSTTFDTTLHAWPVTETIHLADSDLTMSASYDLGLGVVTDSTSFSGERNEYSHDALGRVTERRFPGGAAESYIYELGAPVSRIIKRALESTSGGTLDSYSYVDGHGRPLLTKLEAAGGRWRVADAAAYNSRKLVTRKWIPYFSATPDFEAPDPQLPGHETTYDPMGRTVESLAPDGGRSRTIYRPLETLQLDAEDLAHGGSPDRRRSDGQGRIIEVEERNGDESYLTRYSWNARNELETIVDALGNTRRFRFDTLGRLVEIDDPDRGLLNLRYDDAGNLVERRDARGQVVLLAHDAANRPVEKIHRGAGAQGADLVDTREHYDVPAGAIDLGAGVTVTSRNTAGRPAWIEDQSGETHFSYDERGNVEWIVRRLRDAAGSLGEALRTQREYDLLNREIAVIFPDNDLLRFEYDEGSFVTSLRGDGPGARVILADAEYNPNGRPLRLQLGNGTESHFEYDASERLRVDRLVGPGGAPGLRHEQYTYDLTSTLVGIDDLRPSSVLPLDSPRRTTARFESDELHRLTRVRFGTEPSAGSIAFTHDALGNLLGQATPGPGEAGHIADPSVQLGALTYSGGRSGRSGRRPGDGPGPHALTGSESGLHLLYDANGNVIQQGEAKISYDFEDRLVRHVSGDSTAEYVFDHAGRRAIRRVQRGRTREEIWQLDAAAEMNADGTLTKFAFLDGRRIARIQGMLSTSRAADQRLALASGWTLISVAVETTARLRDAFGSDASVYAASGPSGLEELDPSSAVPPGKALWVHVPEGRTVTLRGRARVLQGTSTSQGPLHAWPQLEAFRPAEHLVDPVPLFVYDAPGRRWLLRNPELPAFLNNAPEDLGSARAFYSEQAVSFEAATADSTSVVFYHTDAVGSVAALTDASGSLIEERAHYPYGGLRHVHRPGAPLGGSNHDFTGHERDSESGLVQMGARSYLDLTGTFLCPDPRFVAVAGLGAGNEADQQSFAAFLANPQMGNLYAHALRNPLKHVDPTGLEPAPAPAVSFSPALAADPTFKQAWRVFASSNTGKEVLESIEANGGRVYLTRGKVTYRNLLDFSKSRRDFNMNDGMGVVKLDMAKLEEMGRLNEMKAGETTNLVAREIFIQLSGVGHELLGATYARQFAERGLAAGAHPNQGSKEAERLWKSASVSLFLSLEEISLSKNPTSDPELDRFEKEIQSGQDVN